jgi:hypothetical protein
VVGVGKLSHRGDLLGRGVGEMVLRLLHEVRIERPARLGSSQRCSTARRR